MFVSMTSHQDTETHLKQARCSREMLEQILCEHRRILMVEDDSDVIVLYKRMFRGINVDVTYISSASVAYEVIGDGCPFDLVLVDLRLNNGKTGVDLIRHTELTCPEKPLAVCTEHPNELLVQGYDGTVVLILKPLTPEKLLKVLWIFGLTPCTHASS